MSINASCISFLHHQRCASAAISSEVKSRGLTGTWPDNVSCWDKCHTG